MAVEVYSGLHSKETRMKLAHYRLHIAIALGAALVFAAACSKKKDTKEEQATEEAVDVDPEAPSIVIAMIDAHGGMPVWRTAKTVSFESEFSSAGDSTAPTVNRVMVDQESRRAYVDDPNTGESAVWDGTRAWSVNWSQPYAPHFAALVEYYFMGLPWITMDPGVRLSVAENDSLWDDPTPYRVVKISFAGSSNVPRGTHRLFIDPESKRLKAC